MILLPKVPMRPRIADQRVGFFTVERVNYGLDEQKAATETFITRWRLEPKDPAAYARGELVEPIKPIVYYIDPATPTKWRRYVKEGVESWQKVFEKAGFKNAILAKDPPTKDEDPDWDPDDARYSMVRWAASLVRNAMGPSTPDPRSGEIINSEIVWYHNHMRSYRNRLMIETGAANPDGAHARHSRRADGRDDAPGHRARDRPRARPRSTTWSRRRSSRSTRSARRVHEQVRRERDDHGLRATELRRAAGRRSQAERFHSPPRTLRRLRDQLGLPVSSRSRRRPTTSARRSTTGSCNQTGALPYRYVPQAVRRRRSAVADGRHRRRSGEGDGLRAQEHAKGRAAARVVDDAHGRRLSPISTRSTARRSACGRRTWDT